MAKNGIEKKIDNGGALAVAGAADFFSAPTVANAGVEDRMIPALHLYQGTSKEADQFGPGFAMGDLLDAVEKRKTASRNIAVIKGVKRWKRWNDGEKAPVYDYDDRSKVPPEDLEWTGEGESRKPPLATETFEFMVLIEGEAFPYVARFKRTGYKAGQLLFELCERAKAKKRIAKVGFGVSKGEGAQGGYAAAEIRDAGNASDEMVRDVIQWFGRLNTQPVKVQGESGGDDIPI